MAVDRPAYMPDTLPENPTTKEVMTNFTRVLYHVDNLGSLTGGGDILEKEEEVAKLLEYYLFGSKVSCLRYFVFLPQDLRRRYIGAHIGFIREMLQHRELELEGFLRRKPEAGWRRGLDEAIEQVRAEFGDLRPTTVDKVRSRIQYLVRNPPYFLDPGEGDRVDTEDRGEERAYSRIPQ